MVLYIYMSWTSRRKSRITLIFLCAAVILGGFLVLPVVIRTPTCFDGRENGNELGVDCGGECALQCVQYTQDINIKWQRSYPIVKGFYNSVAYLENQNFQAGIKQIKYKFRLYDKDRILIAERDGETFIEPNRGFVIFEQQIPVGSSVPLYTTFDFTEPISMYKTDPLYDDLIIRVTNQLLQTNDIKPRFSATLKNTSDTHTISGIDAYVVLYDEEDNAVQVGKTRIEALSPREEKNIFIVWQNQFDKKPVRFEVIPRYNPFTQTY